MAIDKNIKNFTAADIEKYHKGLLSAQERHDLERAALDDPFLADALEGYAFVGNNMQADLAELRSRLAEKMEDAKVIALPGQKKKAIPWLRIAALVIVIAGIGFLADQFVFNNKKPRGIAKLEEKNTNEVKSPDTSSNSNFTALDDSRGQNAPAVKTQEPVKGS